MFGIGSTELLVILIVALVVLGPKSLPGIAKTLGKAMGEFRRVTNEFQRTMNAEVAQEEHEKRKKEAEEELFGQSNKDTAASEKNTTQQDPEHVDASTAKTEPAPSATSNDNIAEKEVINTETSENEKLSAVEKAVKKAEAEAAEAPAQEVSQKHEEKAS